MVDLLVHKLRNRKVRSAFAPERPPTRSSPRIETAVTIGGCLLHFLVGGIMIYIDSSSGTLVVESEDETSEITVGRVPSDTESGFRFQVVKSITGSKSVQLDSGHYRILPFHPHKPPGEAAFRVSKDQFVLPRGGKVVVQVSKLPRKGSSNAAPAAGPP